MMADPAAGTRVTSKAGVLQQPNQSPPPRAEITANGDPSAAVRKRVLTPSESVIANAFSSRLSIDVNRLSKPGETPVSTPKLPFGGKDITLGKKIGTTPVAEIYQAQAKDETILVKKFLSEVPGKSANYTSDRFTEEVKIRSKLSHPRLLKFYGVIDDMSMKALICEYPTGGDFATKVKSPDGSESKTQDQVLKIALDIAQALQYLHAFNIVLRDLRPSSFVFDSNGILKLVDYNVGFDDQPVDESGDGFRWAAPEVLRREPATKASDIYSFGMILSFVVTCHLPYESVPAATAAMQLAKGVLRPPPLQASTNCSEDLAALVHDCLREEPKARPSINIVAHKLCKLAGMDAVPVVGHITPPIQQSPTRAAIGGTASSAFAGTQLPPSSSTTAGSSSVQAKSDKDKEKKPSFLRRLSKTFL